MSCSKWTAFQFPLSRQNPGRSYKTGLFVSYHLSWNSQNQYAICTAPTVFSSVQFVATSLLPSSFNSKICFLSFFFTSNCHPARFNFSKIFTGVYRPRICGNPNETCLFARSRIWWRDRNQVEIEKSREDMQLACSTSVAQPQIPAKKIIRLKIAEDDFRRKMLNELKKRKRERP